MVVDAALEVAPTERAALIVTVQAPVPVQALLQPPKVDPDAGVALRVTAPEAYDCEQSVPQLIPAGEEETVPLPVPALLTVRVYPEDAGRRAATRSAAPVPWSCAA